MNIHTSMKSADVIAINPRAVVGGNNPPTLFDRAREFYRTLAAFLKETPVIQSHEEAKSAASFIERARATLGEIEDDRKLKVRPLNDQVDTLNEQYRAPRESIKSIMDEIKRRLTAFATAEEARREREAEEKRQAAAEAERVAREAEAIEREAKEDADLGVVGVSVASAIAQADQAFGEFKRADRDAARAARMTTVRLAGGMSRAVSMRKSETLVLDDVVAAINAMGVTDTIKDAVLSSARAYRKLNGSLPAGVTAVTERTF